MKKKQTRQVKLCGKYRPSMGGLFSYSNRGKEVPWLNVSGVWLEKAGFPIGTQVQITVDNELLIIQKLPVDGATKH